MSPPGRRLTKRDVETLLEHYDADPVGALSVALHRHLPGPHRGPAERSWEDLVAATGFDADRAAALVARDQAALDGLAGELNELRALPR